MRTFIFLTLAVWAGAAMAQAPVYRVIRAGGPAANLLRNPGFEQGGDGWTRWSGGYTIAAGEGRNGSAALVCESPDGKGEHGGYQQLNLARTAVAPLVVRGWSRAQDVSGAANGDYSLYVDIVYDDGSPLWGQVGAFHCGTHGWEKQEFVILPARPVKTLTLHCLFRGHAGKVWFDDISLEEVRAESGSLLYQGVPVAAPAPTAPIHGRQGYATNEYSLAMADNSIASLKMGDRELAARVPSGFMARDVAADSDFYPFVKNACAPLNLKLETQISVAHTHLEISGRVTDTTGKDRAITLIFALPIDATGWRWGDDVRTSRVIQGNGEFTNPVAIRAGATGTMSQYPLGAIYDKRTGLAMAIDMAKPAQYRVSYHAGAKQLLIAYDFGLVKESERFPSSADFKFVMYPFDPAWGFRSAFEKLTRIFPDYFAVRSKEQGIWMPFTDVSTVQGWQDFGFRYHEGDSNIPWDDEHGILSFRYTEPMTWWMPMAKGTPRTESEVLKERDSIADGANKGNRELARASRVAAMADSDGHPGLEFQDAPWCDGAVWSLNPNPHLPGPLNFASVYWTDDIKRRIYGPGAKGTQDGEYLDSLEGYVTIDLNFRRDHFRYTTVPLTFDSGSKQPALYKGLAVFEFEKWMGDDVHRMGKLMFANGVPYRYAYLCSWLDVMGTETNWLSGDAYRPVPDSLIALWRTMSGAKPYLLLMNTDFDKFGPEMVEKYFQRSLFNGFYPSFFSHNAADNVYWGNPNWYNRDRPLFKRYQPVIKKVAEAGWQPVTHARSSNPAVLVERFGPDSTGKVYLTVFNSGETAETADIALDTRAIKVRGGLAPIDLLTGKPAERIPAGFRVHLAPNQATAVSLSK